MTNDPKHAATPEVLQEILELGQRATSAAGKAQPRSALPGASPIINIAPTAAPSPAGRAEELIGDVARAILGGDPIDSEEMADARACAVDVLKVFAERDRAQYEAPSLKYIGRVPSVTLHLVPSTNRPGQLSMRREPTDPSWWPVFEALEAAGFKVGDVVQLTRIGGAS